MAGVPGNSMTGVGYGCEQPHLVSLWRKSWSSSAAHGGGSGTAADAPFLLVTIAPGGAEGHGAHMSPFRWAQVRGAIRINRWCSLLLTTATTTATTSTRLAITAHCPTR